MRQPVCALPALPGKTMTISAFSSDASSREKYTAALVWARAMVAMRAKIKRFTVHGSAVGVRGTGCEVRGSFYFSLWGLKLVHFSCKFFDLIFNFFVFFHFAAQEADGYFCFFLYPVRGQDIHVSGLVVRGCKAVDLDDPLLDQFLEAVVELAQAQTHFPGHLALGQVGVFLKQFKKAISDFGFHFKKSSGLFGGTRYGVRGARLWFVASP